MELDHEEVAVRRWSELLIAAARSSEEDSTLVGTGHEEFVVGEMTDAQVVVDEPSKLRGDGSESAHERARPEHVAGGIHPHERHSAIDAVDGLRDVASFQATPVANERDAALYARIGNWRRARYVDRRGEKRRGIRVRPGCLRRSSHDRDWNFRVGPRFRSLRTRQQDA